MLAEEVATAVVAAVDWVVKVVGLADSVVVGWVAVDWVAAKVGAAKEDSVVEVCTHRDL